MGTQLSPPQKGFDPSDTVLDGSRAPPLHVYCGQTAGWIKMAFGTEMGLGPGHIVLDGDPAPLPIKGHSPPIFGRCLLWANAWMDEDATWCGDKSRTR